MDFFKNKRGVVTIYISFIIIAIIVVLIGAVFAPMGVLFNSAMYVEGEKILLMANDSIQQINDTTVRTAVTDNLNNAFAAAENNIEVNNDIFRYSWLLVVGLAALTVFMLTRRLVEVQGGGIV